MPCQALSRDNLSLYTSVVSSLYTGRDHDKPSLSQHILGSTHNILQVFVLLTTFIMMWSHLERSIRSHRHRRYRFLALAECCIKQRVDYTRTDSARDELSAIRSENYRTTRDTVEFDIMPAVTECLLRGPSDNCLRQGILNLWNLL